MGVLLLFLSSCGPNSSPPRIDVIMETELGEVGIHLYDATPLHKENFLKLSREGFFDSLAFHRVLYDFMVQVGDPRTRKEYPLTPASQDLPDGPGYTLPPEIVDTLIHTRGKIGAARWGDDQNPERRSSGSQFYVVTGEPATIAKLDSNEMMYTGVKKGEQFMQYQTAIDSGEFSGTFDRYLEQQNFQDFAYRSDQIAAYLEEGGAPWLDFQYTIFGEVVYGMEVITNIEITPTDPYDRPEEVIRIIRMKFPEKSAD